MTALRFFAVSYAHLLVCFLIGIMPTSLLYRRSVLFRGRASALLFLSLSSVCGFLVWPFLIFNVAIILKATVPAVIFPCTAFLLLASSVTLWRSREVRDSLITLAKGHKTTVLLGAFLLFPIATYHIILPLIQHGIVMGYAIGNDGAAYLGAIDGLKSTYWEVNKPGLVLARPLMQYAMAITSVFWRQDNYFAYGVTTAVVAFLIAAAFGTTYVQLTALRNRPMRAWFIFVVAAMIIGVTGTFQTLYYTGTLSQYYGALPIYLALTVPLVKIRPLPLFLWSFFVFAAVITMYTIANLPVPVGVVLAYLGIAGWINRRKHVFRHYLFACIAAVAGGLLAGVLYRYELRFLLEWASVRGYAHPYDILTSVVVTLGLFTQYADPSILAVQFLKLALLVLLAVALFAALDRRNRRALAYLVLPLLSVGVMPLFDPKNLLLTKYRAILLPMILMVPMFPLVRWREKKTFIVMSSGMLALALTVAAGREELRVFYLPTMIARNIYVDAAVAGFRKSILDKYKPGSRIYCNDYTAERHTFLRALFRPYDWQPVRAASVWPEFGYDTARHPPWVDKYQYDYFLDADDAHGPVEIRAANTSSLIAQVPHLYSLYSGQMQNLEFGLKFETDDWKVVSRVPSVSRFSMTVSAAESSIFYIHPRNEARVLHIAYHLRGPKPGTLSIGSLPIAAIVPTAADKTSDLIIDCRQLCTQHVNELKIELPAQTKLTIGNVWFSNQ